MQSDEDRDASGEEAMSEEEGSDGGYSDYSFVEMGATAARGLPSVGSALHAAGKCSRCCFYLKNRCRNGVNCQFCHLPHERRPRGRGCRGHGTSKEVCSPPGFRAPPGLSISSPVDGPLTPDSSFLRHCAYSQPPTPQEATCLPPVRMATSLPATPSGMGSKCMPRVSGPLNLPPLHPPPCLPMSCDQAPPPPENSPGGPSMTAPQHEASGPFSVDMKPCKPPGTFLPSGDANRFRPAAPILGDSRPAAPILGTLPSPSGASLPRLLGNRGPPPGLEARKATSALDCRPSPNIWRPDSEALAASPEVNGFKKPLKVFMTDYDCEVPLLNPSMPAKKRLPEWSL